MKNWRWSTCRRTSPPSPARNMLSRYMELKQEKIRVKLLHYLCEAPVLRCWRLLGRTRLCHGGKIRSKINLNGLQVIYAFYGKERNKGALAWPEVILVECRAPVQLPSSTGFQVLLTLPLKLFCAGELVLFCGDPLQTIFHFATTGMYNCVAYRY